MIAEGPLKPILLAAILPLCAAPPARAQVELIGISYQFASRLVRERLEEIKRIDKLVRDLGDDDFETREKASKGLLEIGEPALPALKKARRSDDPEVKWRADAAFLDILVDAPLPKPLKAYAQEMSKAKENPLLFSWRRYDREEDQAGEFKRLLKLDPGLDPEELYDRLAAFNRYVERQEKAGKPVDEKKAAERDLVNAARDGNAVLKLNYAMFLTVSHASKEDKAKGFALLAEVIKQARDPGDLPRWFFFDKEFSEDGDGRMWSMDNAFAEKNAAVLDALSKLPPQLKEGFKWGIGRYGWTKHSMTTWEFLKGSE